MIFIGLSTRHHVCSKFVHVTGLCVFCTNAPFPCDLKVPLPQVSHIRFGLFLALVLYLCPLGMSSPVKYHSVCCEAFPDSLSCTLLAPLLFLMFLSL